MPLIQRHVIGVDVGTASVRAGVFDLSGRLLGVATQDITVYRSADGHVEQSSREIWRAVCMTVRSASSVAGIAAEKIEGIGFDATCSLVVLGADENGLPVGDPQHPDRDIVVWMDHRAIRQAERINAGRHAVLRFVGGTISPEMQMPKLLWLKEHRRAVYDAASHFMDLVDFLTFRATGSLQRSSCPLTCKWNHLGHEGRWDEDYLQAIGLGELADDLSRIGQEIVVAGTPLSRGLTVEAAAQLGLRPGTPVAAGLIDAHAGGIGTVGATGDVTGNLAYVFGTSACTMTTTTGPVFVPGVWGPYFSAMVPGLWLNEGGQSAAGAAIEHLLSLHPAHAEATTLATAAGLSLPDWLVQQALADLGERPNEDLVERLCGLHIVPEFLGNRAPHADPRARAVVCGLGMERDVSSLVTLYLAGVCAIGYGLRQIIDTQAAHGADIERVMISGGAGRSSVARQFLADAARRPVVTVTCEEPVLLGSAILGAVAAGAFDDVATAMRAMSHVCEITQPSSTWKEVHEQRFTMFGRLQALSRVGRDS